MRSSLPTLDGPVLAAAITTADCASVPHLYCTTAAGIQLTVERYTQDWGPVDDTLRRDISWWPDEWHSSCDMKLGDEAERVESRALDEWVSQHSEDEGDPAVVAARDALVAALGDPRVRAVFAEFGADPVLVVNETDGGEKEALEAFEKLNAGRDDDAVRSARAFWAAGVGGEGEGDGDTDGSDDDGDDDNNNTSEA